MLRTACQEATTLEYYPYVEFLAKTHQGIMGHSVCNTSVSFEVDWTHSNVLFDLEDCSWNPLQWQYVMNMQSQIIHEHPNVTLWNEVLLHKPRSMKDAVQAVFYVGEESYEAHKEAKRIGRPLLKVNLEDDQDLFACVDEATNVSLHLLQTQL